MVKTFNDFIFECEHYTHSQEYLEFMRECSEITLMEQYLKNQEYMKENDELIQSSNIEERYFSESITQGDIDHMYDVLYEKSEGFFNTIKNGISKIIKTIKNFFIRSDKDAGKKEKKKAKLLKRLGKLKESDIPAIQEIVEKARRAAGKFVPLKGKQPGEKIVKDAIKFKLPKDIRDWVIVGLTTEAIADVSGFANQDMGPISIDSLERALNDLDFNHSNTVNATITNLKETWKATIKHGMVIHTKAKKIREHRDQFWKIENKLLGENSSGGGKIDQYQQQIYDKNEEKQQELTQKYNAETDKLKHGQYSNADERNAIKKDANKIAQKKVDKNVNLGNKINTSNELKTILSACIGNSISLLIGCDKFDIIFANEMLKLLGMDKNNDDTNNNNEEVEDTSEE